MHCQNYIIQQLILSTVDYIKQAEFNNQRLALKRRTDQSDRISCAKKQPVGVHPILPGLDSNICLQIFVVVVATAAAASARKKPLFNTSHFGEYVYENRYRIAAYN